MAEEYLKETYLKKVADFKYDPREVTVLDEAIVTEKKKTKVEIINEAHRTHLFSGVFARRVYRDSIPGSAAFSAIDLLTRIPGVWVTGVYPEQSIRLPRTIMGALTPQVLINGSLASFDFLQTLRAIEVSFIDISLPGDGAVQGILANGTGVISVYLDIGLQFDDELPEEYPGIANFKIPGFYKAREFYKPDYVMEKPEKPDYRTTLFWEPQVALNNEGKSSINFYTGDKTGSYWVKVEGITNDGRPVSGIYDIDVLESTN